MKYKVGDLVIIIRDYNMGCVDRYRKGKNFKNQIGKIVDKTKYDYYFIEILNCPNKKECKIFKRNKDCMGGHNEDIKALNSLKLKKLVKHGV